ncbi:MAG: hypothetical protein ACI9SC_001134 [Gammaproteobacteria bacterium]|jgi:hypothetical protein
MTVYVSLPFLLTRRFCGRAVFKYKRKFKMRKRTIIQLSTAVLFRLSLGTAMAADHQTPDTNNIQYSGNEFCRYQATLFGQKKSSFCGLS